MQYYTCTHTYACILQALIVARYCIVSFSIWTGLNVHYYTCSLYAHWVELWTSMPRDLNNVTASQAHFMHFEFRILCNREKKSATPTPTPLTVRARIHSLDLRIHFKCSHTHTHYTPIQWNRRKKNRLTEKQLHIRCIKTLIDLSWEDHWWNQLMIYFDRSRIECIYSNLKNLFTTNRTKFETILNDAEVEKNSYY